MLDINEKIMYNEETKLYYHGYDSSKTLFWADKKTGLSKNFWLRSIGWFTVGLVDVLDFKSVSVWDQNKEGVLMHILGNRF